MRFLRTVSFIVILALFVPLLAGCDRQGGAMRDGYYTAKAADFGDGGWKDYVTIYVSDGQIVTAEFNAQTKSGFIRSWDSDYLSNEYAETELYPSKYFRAYTTDLVRLQNPANILAVAGAERQLEVFQLLAEAAIAHARAGDKTIAVVGLP
ncbi:MAG: FMN-binding protein [Clostridiales bacterium]|jgi:major membrane immunogen (membrane-anchored lipoprotein)|nr:FMN-binding protein [Clostridiales bacterium]